MPTPQRRANFGAAVTGIDISDPARGDGICATFIGYAGDGRR
jgi:hypothetical protein